MDKVELRKIIHIDMDCFYAAVEIRDNPSLANKPVAVGGSEIRRGVLCTCNYIARSFGLHSAMPAVTAIKLCPNLVLLPVNMQKYQNVSKQIQAIFLEYTNLVEPLSLDEAYLDVSHSLHYSGSATLIAEAIRSKIWQKQQLTASAGVASNKFLAKIASGWNKPNGICVIKPENSLSFISKLPVNKLFGVGKVTAAKLANANIKTCTDLQKYSITQLRNDFGKLGIQLYYQVRGIDNRQVEPNQQRKSLSVETTFITDLFTLEQALPELKKLFISLEHRLAKINLYSNISAQFIKIKLNNFKLITAETKLSALDFAKLEDLFMKAYAKYPQPIRLLGVGISFKHAQTTQPTLF